MSSLASDKIRICLTFTFDLKNWNRRQWFVFPCYAHLNLIFPRQHNFRHDVNEALRSFKYILCTTSCSNRCAGLQRRIHITHIFTEIRLQWITSYWTAQRQHHHHAIHCNIHGAFAAATNRRNRRRDGCGGRRLQRPSCRVKVRAIVAATTQIWVNN